MSPCSLNHAFQRITLRMVSVKPSHTQQVQLAAVRPPRRMSSNTERPKSEMIRPSITIDVSCRLEAIWLNSCQPHFLDGQRLSSLYVGAMIIPNRHDVNPQNPLIIVRGRCYCRFRRCVPPLCRCN